MIADVNHGRCLEVASSLRGESIPSPVEGVLPLSFSPADEANFWFFLAAVCHQTSPIGEPPLSGEVSGTTKTGWDYLMHIFRAAAIVDVNWLRSHRWSECTGNDLKTLAGPLLSRPDRRACLIRDMGTKLIDRGWVSIIEAGPFCDFRIAAAVAQPQSVSHFEADDSRPNLLNILSDFEAFADPVRKKSAFFLALMRNAGLWSYRDESQLPAPVDYHEVRGHLRIGTVSLAENVRQKIANGCVIATAEDIAIRSTVRDAIHIISHELKSSPNALHYFFWNLFRTYCLRNAPMCDGRHHAALPPMYQTFVAANGDRQCPFRMVCESADRTIALNDPKVHTDFY